MLLNGFHSNGQALGQDFIYRLKRQYYLVQHNKQNYKNVLLNSRHLNGHTIAFLLQTQTLDPYQNDSGLILLLGVKRLKRAKKTLESELSYLQPL